jgi:hypothetical protein
VRRAVCVWYLSSSAWKKIQCDNQKKKKNDHEKKTAKKAPLKLCFVQCISKNITSERSAQQHHIQMAMATTTPANHSSAASVGAVYDSADCVIQRTAFGALMGIFTTMFVAICAFLGWYLIARAPAMHRMKSGAQKPPQAPPLPGDSS